MTVKELLDIDISDINKLNEKTLCKAVQTLSSAANKRVSNIKQSGAISPAVTAAENIGRFTPAGKNRNELLSEFVRAISFLQSETSTVSGAKKYTEKIKQNLNLPADLSPEETKEENKNFWNTFNDLYNNAQNLWTHSRLGSTVIQDIIKQTREENPGVNWREIADRVQREIDTLYIEESGTNGTSGFFDFGENE